MKFENIEVSGITRIVIEHKKVWEAGQLGFTDEIYAIVNKLKTDRRYRMWVHNNTLNVVRNTGHDYKSVRK